MSGGDQAIESWDGKLGSAEEDGSHGSVSPIRRL